MMEKNRKTKPNVGENAVAFEKTDESGAFGQVIGGGTAVIRGKKPTFTADKDIITDPLGSWTGVVVDDPYEKPIQDADDL